MLEDLGYVKLRHIIHTVSFVLPTPAPLRRLYLRVKKACPEDWEPLEAQFLLVVGQRVSIVLLRNLSLLLRQRGVVLRDMVVRKHLMFLERELCGHRRLNVLLIQIPLG